MHTRSKRNSKEALEQAKNLDQLLVLEQKNSLAYASEDPASMYE